MTEAARSSGVVLLAVLALAVPACRAGGGADDRAGTDAAGGRTVRSAPVPTSSTLPCRPAPLEERAAAVLVVGVGGATTASAPLPAQVAALGVGGVILLGPNIVDAAQVRALIDGLRQRSPRGLLVTVDEEGGRVSRLRPILGATPSARTLGQRPLPEIADVAAQRGTTVRGLGFDLIFAPVVDADSGSARGAIGDRSFGATPAEAGSRGRAFAEGLARTGLAGTAKHFPGQGGLPDSHEGKVVSNASLDDVRAGATAAFGPVLEAQIPAVMMSHVTYPALGPMPASLEPAAYRLLRSLGFDGVAVTDALGMSAVTDRWTIAQAAAMAVAAGADLVLANQGDQAPAMREAIRASVAAGRLPEARLDEAVRRVLRLQGKEPSTMVCG